MNTKLVKALRASIRYNSNKDKPRHYFHEKGNEKSWLVDPKSTRALYQAMKKDLYNGE